MLTIFADEALQARFGADGFVHLPGLLDEERVRVLREHFAALTAGGEVRNSAYGMFVSLDHGELAQKRHTRDLIRDVVRPRADAYCRDYQTHLGSYVVKMPGPAAYTHPHQDWTFVDDELMEETFSITMWIALGDYGREQGSLGFVRGSHRFFPNVNCSPSPAARTPTQGLEAVLLRNLVFPEMRRGDALAFNNKTIHAALPNLGNEPRIAAAVGLRPAATRLFHYTLKPGTRDTLLKLEVEEDFFLRYTNGALQALWEQGQQPEGCTLVGERPHVLGRRSAEELETLCREAALGLAPTPA